MYSSLRQCANDLERHGKLIRIRQEVDPDLEMAEIHLRVNEAGGPALLFERVKGSPFQAISNLYGTIERTGFIFRKTLPLIKKVIELKADPTNFLKKPLRYTSAPFTALKALPQKPWFEKPVMYGNTSISKLPLIKSWPMDGGAFVTLPQVYTEDPDTPGHRKSNIGMYRIQLTGNEYELDKEIGLHYQIHRGIGVHHTRYNELDKPFKASIFVGGPPSHAFAAIMPLPEGLSELTFAGMLAGRSFRYAYDAHGHFLSTDADFVITGTIQKSALKPEGPFGDHLGYYSLQHPFPYMKVDNVYHRKDPLWQFTVVGRPPQEDSSFGWLIHELVADLTAGEFPGLSSIHAVDASGVHPLLLAVGKERYMPFREPKPEEILTIANRILGSGQTSLAKYLFIAAANDNPSLDCHHIEEFFQHFLERVDWRRDLHFQTNTTIDTLDYSGSGWNAGSKVVLACCGKPIRTLATEISSGLRLPQGITHAKVCLPGILAVSASQPIEGLLQGLKETIPTSLANSFPLVVLCDDASFTAATLNNFLWVAFTRSNPSHDMHGVGEFVENKHWGCTGPLIIDARKKKHHAPELVPDSKVKEKVDKMFARGGELAGI